MIRGDRVYDPVDTDMRWKYEPLTWHERTQTGLDSYGCDVFAYVDGDRLRVQHGDDPEAVRWFTLDELNGVGGRWNDSDIVGRWFGEIHAAWRPGP